MSVLSQETRPKVGLCLSGGGARGMAHVGLLELIDSLGIKVDYITGTSMGSVVGSLYSIGYTGKQIRGFMEEIDWKKLFSATTDFSNINIEEKDEFQSYAITLDLLKGKISVPFGFIEGQELQKTLIEYLHPSFYINDFDSLPIPFRCIAADIYTEKKVVLKDGNLTKAVRASMAIPLFFSPIKKDSMLLVDGGLVKNMPVDELYEMGADLIIGSYTGFVMKNRDKITSGIKVFMQTQSVMLIKSSIDQAEKSDIIVYNFLDGYSASDFDKYEDILKIGKENAYNQIDTLINFALQQKKFKNIPPRKSIVGSSDIENLHFDYIQVVRENRVYDFEEKFALNEFKFDSARNYNFNKLFENTDRVYGTRFFSKIFFDVDKVDKKNILTLNLKSSSHNTISIAPRYESENGAAVGLTYTLRNELLKNSRLTVGINLGNDLGGRIKYLKYLFNTNYIWFNFKGFYERNSLTDFTGFGSSSSTASSAFAFTRNYFYLDAGINWSLGKNLYVGVHGSLPYSNIKSKLDLEKSPSTLVLNNLDKFITTNKSANFILKFNSLDDKNFPHKGWKIDSKLDFQFDLSNSYQTSTLNNDDTYSKFSEEIKNKQTTNLSMDVRRYFTFFKKLTLNLQTKFNLNSTIFNDVADSNFNPLIVNNQFVEGLYPRQEGGYVNFYGYGQTRGGFYANYFLVSAGLRYEIVDKLYVATYVNSGWFDNGEINELSGGAIGFEYKSLLGPKNYTGKNLLKLIVHFFTSV